MVRDIDHARETYETGFSMFEPRVKEVSKMSWGKRLLISGTLGISALISLAGWEIHQVVAKANEQRDLAEQEKQIALKLGQAGMTHVVNVRPSETDSSTFVAVLSGDPENPSACEATVEIEHPLNKPILVLDLRDADGKKLIIEPNTGVASDRSDEARMVDKIVGLKGFNC